MTESRANDTTTSAGSEPKAGAPLTVIIGCDTFAPDVNGAATFEDNLAAGLVKRGHNVHIVAPAASWRRGTWTEEHNGQPMTVHRMRSYRWYPHPWLRFVSPVRLNARCGRILDDVKPDVVHFQSHIMMGRGLSIEAKKRGIRLVGTNHVMPENLVEFSLLPKFLRSMATRMAWQAATRTFSRAQAVTTPTRRAAEFLEKETGLRDVYAISCGVDAEKYKPDFSPRSENRIIFVGRVTGEKQIDVLVRAAALLPADLEAKVEIVGEGDQKRNLEHLAENLGITDRVIFTGYLTDEELREAYTKSTVLAMPSIAELQSIVTMEAMATGLPVVAANAMALPHLVHDGENGFLFEPGNAAELADRLERILRMPQAELDQFKQASLRMIAAHDIQRTLTTFESLYRGEPVADPSLEAAPPVPADD